MDNSTAAQLNTRLGLDRNKPRLSPMTTTFDGHDQAVDFATWADDSTFYTDLAYSPDPYLDKTMGDCFSFEKSQLQITNGAPVYYSNSAEDLREWSAAGKLSQSPLETPLTPMSYFPTDGPISPERWLAETDSESCGPDLVSPGDGLDPPISTPVSLKRSWSATSSASAVASSPPSRTSKPRSNNTKTRCKPSHSTLPSAKITETEPANKRGTGRRGSHSIQLRTASRKPRTSIKTNTMPSPPSSLATSGVADADADADADGLLTPDERRARRNHNLVEKQYRNRLNAQFERLLAVLPAERQVGNEDDGDGEDDIQVVDGGGARPRIRGIGDEAGGVEDRRISKAEVLDMATRRIKDLELGRRRLYLEKRELMHNMEMMSGVVAMAQRQS
ncbi:hypothetical protein B0T25DRAFT_210172 [Lasiosphaeria hispida]|uniref:BHLH domain-containing protein n=1 Tax=Lasiosphaeria hispida TaxID=260671 RepID=A0AAJ0HJA9_9PEZI|nr:hypothetical protein B0T25DRAFT_210172 [Lasiosphaeria hispida]